MSPFIAWISPVSIDRSSVVAPASSTAAFGSSSSTCSTPSAARIAIVWPSSSAMGFLFRSGDPRLPGRRRGDAPPNAVEVARSTSHFGDRMSLDDPVVITCAISGALANRDQCPAIPYTPEEYAAEARRIVDEGGVHIHVHARRPDG